MHVSLSHFAIPFRITDTHLPIIYLDNIEKEGEMIPSACLNEYGTVAFGHRNRSPIIAFLFALLRIFFPERDHPTSSANHQPILFLHNTHLTCFCERITGTDSGGSHKGIIDQVATSSANLRFLEWPTSCLSLNGVIRMDTCDSFLEIGDNIAHLRSCQHKITLEHLNTIILDEKEKILEPNLVENSLISRILCLIHIFESERRLKGENIHLSLGNIHSRIQNLIFCSA